MFPCCNLCYQKYINEDGTFDEERYEKIYQKAKEICKNGLIDQRCKCICHQDGKNILH